MKSYFYLFKFRFIDNSPSTQLSLLISSIYMCYTGSFFGMGLGNTIFIIVFTLVGLIIGLNTKILSSLFIFLFIYLGSLIGNGQGKVLSILVFFIAAVLIVRKIKKTYKSNISLISSLF